VAILLAKHGKTINVAECKILFQMATFHLATFHMVERSKDDSRCCPWTAEPHGTMEISRWVDDGIISLAADTH
jgi:hypothetical protein